MTHNPRKPTTGLKGPLARLATAFLATALLATAAAQSLAPLLPQGTFMTVGLSGLAKHQGKLQPFIDEWERLDLTRLLEASADADAEDELPAALKDLDLLELIGDEVWVGVSVSDDSPMPAVTLVIRASEKVAAQLSSAIMEEADDAAVETGVEGRIEFKSFGDEDGVTTAVAIDGNFVAVSTDVGTLRGVLRRYQGAVEPNFTNSATYSASLAPLQPAVFSFMVDWPSVVNGTLPLLQGSGFEQSAERLGNLFRTLGVYASAVRLTAAGIESLSVQALGDSSLDPALYGLLTNKTAFPAGVLSFVPTGAVAVQAAALDLQRWWAYLDQLSADLPELGIGGLDAFLADSLGLDLKLMLFGWMGPGVGSITLSAPSADVGASSMDLFGDAVFLVAVKDQAAAQAGLSQFLTMATMVGSSFTDPGNNTGIVQPTTRKSSGVDVTTYAIAEGQALETAFADGFLVVATSPTAMDAALAAKASGRGGPGGALAAAQKNVPGGAISMSLSDNQASLEQLAKTVASQFGLVSGIAGSGGVDFDAAEAASAALTQFFSFVADRFGTSYSYQVVDGSTLRGYGVASVSW